MPKSKLDKVDKELDEVKKEMKRLAGKYVEAKNSGNDSAVKMIIRDLKHFNKIKEKLDSEYDTLVSNIGKGASAKEIEKMTEVRTLIKQVIKETLNKV
jgi:tetrahydromethanopterin S-methyltransferase subunit G